MSLSGRVDTLENQVTVLFQDLLRKVPIDSLSSISSNWNQQFDITENKICETVSSLNELQVLYSNLALDIDSVVSGSISGITSGYVTESELSGFLSGYVQETFETINQNLSQYPFELYYSTGQDLTGIYYTLPDSEYIIKTLEYNASGLLVKISLTGNPVPSVTLNKQLLYSTGEDLTGAYYY